MDLKEMFSTELCDLNVFVNNEDELFEIVANRLFDKGFVNENYLSGLKKRERNFPTGLITQYLNIALPHSDTIYIEKPFVYIVRLNEPIQVKQMGDNQDMSVKDLLFLGIKEPTGQVGLLQNIMTLFMDESFVSAYINEKKEKELIKLIKTNL